MSELRLSRGGGLPTGPTQQARWPSLLLWVLAAAVVAGCSRSGDFGGFLVHHITRHGGRTHLDATPPGLQARWIVQHDRTGFQAVASDIQFAAVDSFMRQAFGTPRQSGVGVKTGRAFGIWSAADIGVAVQVIARPEGVEVVCVRGMSSLAEVGEELAKPWWRRLW